MRLRARAFVLTVVSIVVTAATTSLAAEPPLRAIKVSAMYEMEVVPDEVVLSLAIGTEDDKSPLVAKSKNDERTRAILAAIKNCKIDEKYIKIDCLQIHPDQCGQSQLKNTANIAKRTINYTVRRNIDVTLQDFNLLEPIISDALRLGANEVSGILYRTTKHQEYQKKARQHAVAYAKEKASHLAELNGMMLGKAIAIEEAVEGEDNNHVTGGGGMGGGFFSVIDSLVSEVNVVEDEFVTNGASKEPAKKEEKEVKEEKGKKEVAVQTTSDAGQTIAPGTITISATVIITFELKDPKPK